MAEARSDRRHDPEGDDGNRTPFERDRDSILYTTAFRRLAGVTQVVSPNEGQIYHNRLTHSLEVAQSPSASLSFFSASSLIWLDSMAE